MTTIIFTPYFIHTLYKTVTNHTIETSQDAYMYPILHYETLTHFGSARHYQLDGLHAIMYINYVLSNTALQLGKTMQ